MNVKIYFQEMIIFYYILFLFILVQNVPLRKELWKYLSSASAILLRLELLHTCTAVMMLTKKNLCLRSSNHLYSRISKSKTETNAKNRTPFNWSTMIMMVKILPCITIGCYQCALVLNLKKNYGTEFCQLSKTYHVSMVNNIQWSRTWNQNSVHIVHFPNNNSNDGQKTKQCQACSFSRLGRADSPSRSCQLPGRKMSGQTSPNIGLRW